MNPSWFGFVLLLSIQFDFTTAKCGDKYKGKPSSCCPDGYLHLCCPGISKPCNKNATRSAQKPPGKPQGGQQFVKPPCMHPWNSPACQDGFYFDKVANMTKPCPNGFYCPQDSICIIPCPEGAYCMQEKLVNAKKDSPLVCQQAEKCCQPSNSVPVFNPFTKKLECGGQKIPTPCPEGYYCPNVTVKKECPDGYFCREAFTEPQDCPILSVCPTGAKAPVSAGAGVLFIFILFLMFIGLIYYFRKRETVHFYARMLRYKVTRKENDKYSISTGVERHMDNVAKVEIDGGNTIIPKTNVINLEFENLSLTLKKQNKKVLEGVTGKIMSGEVTAIMGPSGAGKTTLLNTLSGKAYYGKREGQIKVNSLEVDDLKSIKTIMGFVPQEDTMHRSLTIVEVLRYQAELRLPANISSAEKRQRVNQIIDLLDLTKVKNTKIGDEEARGISGGQRKRVNIGMELVADPTLLFLDEPTSGLDSTSSLLVLEALRKVAEKGRLTVVCVIHQPRYEIYSAMHKVLFLGPGGRTVFLGTVNEADNYFTNQSLICPKNINPADFYMDVIGGLYDKQEEGGFEAKSLFELWENENRNDGVSTSSEEEAKVVMMPNTLTDQHRKLPNFFKQFMNFTTREAILQFRLVKSLLMDQFLVLLAGGILGALRRNAPLDQFFVLQTLSSLAVGLTAMLSSLRCFGNSRTTFWRESSTGINKLSYFLAVNVVQLPIIVVTPMMYLSLLYPLIAPRGYLVYHYLAVLGAQFACTGTGYAISTLFNPKNSQMASVTFALILSLVSGLSPSLCEMNDFKVLGPVFYNLSYSRWFVEAMFEKEAIRFPPVKDAYVHMLANKNGYSLDNYGLCIAVLFIFGVVYRILAFLFLVFTNRGKQQ